MAAAAGDASTRLFDLSGRIALVTGAGRGIGRAIADGLAAHGATVVLAGRSTGVLEAAADELGKAGLKAEALRLDVTSDEDVARARQEMLDRHGGLDILVNNAGIDPHYASMEKTSVEQWNEIIAVNLTGVFRCCRQLGELMIARGGGSIINISSIAGHIGLKRQVPYNASKGGVEQLTKGIAQDWAEFKIRANSIAYGFVETDLTAGMTGHPHIGPRLLSRIPLQRFGQLSDMAGPAIFLASDASSYVTGHSLKVDGGWTSG